MRGLAVVIVAAVASALPALAQAGDTCTLGLVTDVALLPDPSGQRLLIPAKVDGSPVVMMVDTGAQVSALNKATYHRVNTTPLVGSHLAGDDDVGRGIAIGMGGISSASFANIESLQIGRMHGGLTMMVTDHVFGSHGQTIDGLVGATSLGDYDVDLNVAGGSLRLYAARGACSHPAVALDQPLYAVPMLPHVGNDRSATKISVQIDGHELRALLDTGAPETLLFSHAAALLGLSAAADATHVVTISGVGSETRAGSRQVIDRVSLGPIALLHVQVIVDPETGHDVDMVLGMNFFRRAHVWISNSSGMVVMQVPPAPSPPIGTGN